MISEAWVWRDGKLVEKHLAAPLHVPRAAPGVITDTMADAAPHPCTGKMMDSKSAFRRITREHGCIEIGTEKMSPGRASEPSRHEIESAVARNWRE
jgi:hypothetical protein